jgi:hypothetical protein
MSFWSRSVSLQNPERRGAKIPKVHSKAQVLILSLVQLYPIAIVTVTHLQKLQREKGHNHSIRWEFLSIADARPEVHANETCYHFADIAASATFSAIDVANRQFGETDDRFLRLLRPAICRDARGRYGFKFFPPSAPISDRPLMEFVHSLK